jgi:hypothetical protein
LRIGLNCLQPFGYGYPFANGGIDARALPDARLATIKAVGFDFVRMAIDPEALLTADGASYATTTELDRRVGEVVAGIKRRLSAGLRVMVDLHFHGSAVTVAPGWQSADVLDGVRAAKFSRLRFILISLAAALHAFSPDDVALELFNEPPYPNEVATSNYIRMIEDLWEHARIELREHTLVISGNALGAYDSKLAGARSGLTALTASHFDSNTIFTAHDYEGPAFTHQGVAGSPYEHMRNLVYPAADHPGGRPAAEASFIAAAGADRAAINTVVRRTDWASSLAEYFAHYGSRTGLATRLAVLTDWSDAARLSRKQIAIGEFGVNFAAPNKASATSAARRIRDVRENAAQAGLNCIVLHEMQGSDFGIQAPSPPWAFDQAIMAALFR